MADSIADFLKYHRALGKSFANEENALQPDKALEWAERGLKAFPDQPDNRLRDFLVAVYLVRERNDEALQLTWVQFEERPSLELYRKLHAVADQLALWPEQ